MLVVNYINKKWKARHIIVAIFEVHETIRAKGYHGCVVEVVICSI